MLTCDDCGLSYCEDDKCLGATGGGTRSKSVKDWTLTAREALDQDGG